MAVFLEESEPIYILRAVGHLHYFCCGLFDLRAAMVFLYFQDMGFIIGAESDIFLTISLAWNKKIKKYW